MRAIGTAETIRQFLGHKTLALVGFSRNGKKFSNNAYRELIGKGYKIYPVNPATQDVAGVKVYPSLRDLPEPVTAALIVVRPSKTADVVREAAEAGVTSVWIQQGAESEEAVKACQEKQLSFVSGRCILMFAEPAIWLHRVHRGVLRLFGQLPA